MSAYCELLVREDAGRPRSETDQFRRCIMDGTAKIQTLIAGMVEYATAESDGHDLMSADMNEVFREAAMYAPGSGPRVAVITRDPLPVKGDFGRLVGFTGSANTARMFISLKPLDERKATAQQIIARLRPRLAKIPGASLYLQAAQDVRVGGRQSSAEYQFTMQSDNLPDLVAYSPKMLEKLKAIHGIADVNSDLQNQGCRRWSRTTGPLPRDSTSRRNSSTIRFTTHSASGRCRPCTPR